MNETKETIPVEIERAILRCKHSIAALAKANEARDALIRVWLSDDAYKHKTLREFSETPEASRYTGAEREVREAWLSLQRHIQEWGLREDKVSR